MQTVCVTSIHVLKCVIPFVSKLNINSHQFYFTVMFTYRNNIAKHTKEMPAGIVWVTRTAPCEADETCASSFFVFFHACEEEKKTKPLAFISLLKADFGRQITWHYIFVFLLKRTLDPLKMVAFSLLIILLLMALLKTSHQSRCCS